MYVEEKDFTFRIEARCEFPDEYQGDADGYAWTAELRPITGEMFAALVAVLKRHPGWRLRPSNRGRSTDDEVTLILERTIE